MITCAVNDHAISSHSAHRAVTASHSMTAWRQNSIHDRSGSSPKIEENGERTPHPVTGMPSKKMFHSDERRTAATREPKPCNEKG